MTWEEIANSYPAMSPEILRYRFQETFQYLRGFTELVILSRRGEGSQDKAI
ncbi:MAG TPA: hypothetical protein VHL58_10890 [Thermoanaerobaculia bacterium]|nr:hypothetical protein [Thermoanaerobaculia bacterium]